MTYPFRPSPCNAHVTPPALAAPAKRWLPGYSSYDRGVITGMHAIVFSPQAEKVRAFFADVLGMPSADAGGGWLIFALPPAELAVHPAEGGSHHELYLMCDDIQATLTDLRDKGVEVARDVRDQGWGLLAAIRLPDGSELPIYEPRHPSPPRP
jgi:predicted enzyme related to lactoylglutathione lyase